MTTNEKLEAYLHYFNIEIIEAKGNHYIVGRNYEIEIEQNGIYKLLSEGQVIAPFDNEEELCKFILL